VIFFELLTYITRAKFLAEYNTLLQDLGKFTEQNITEVSLRGTYNTKNLLTN